MNRLQDLSARLLTAPDLTTVFSEVLDAAMDLLGTDLGMTQLYDGESHTLKLVALRGFPEGFAERFAVVSVGDATSCSLALEQTERVIVDDAATDARLEKNWPVLLEAGIRAVTTTPFISRRGALLGMVSTQFRSPHRPSERELRILDLYIRQATLIIERIQSEDALRESERRFREMIDALPTAIYTTDAEGRITHFNPAAVAFSGRTPELGTDHWCVTWKLYHPDGTPMPHDECPMAIALKEGRAIHGVEAIAERPDGTRRWFEPYPTPLRDAAGNVTGGINMLVDITERKQAEVALRESETKHRTLFEMMDEGFCIIEKVETPPGEPLDFRYLEANPAFALQAGVGDVVGRTIRQAFPGEPEEWYETYDTIVRTGEPIRFERGLITQGRVLELYAFRVADESGRRVAVIFRDITERKKADEDLRTASQMKDELLGLVAHEFRTPLTTLTGNIDVLVRRFNDLAPEMRNQALHEMQRDGDRLRRLIQNMLVVARGESRNAHELEPILLQRTLRDIVAAEQARDSSRAITLAVPNTLPPVVANAGYIEQVVENLITNARKYSHIATPIEITVTTEGSFAVVGVSDIGDVLSADKVGRFFEPFYRSDGAAKRAGGAGLGLAVCATLVERMEGEIWTRPNPGGGLQVLFSIPLAEIDGDD